MLSRIEKIDAVANWLENYGDKVSEEKRKIVIKGIMYDELVETRKDILAILEILEKLYKEEQILWNRINKELNNNEAKKWYEPIKRGITLHRSDLNYCGNKVIMMLDWFYWAGGTVEEFCNIIGADVDAAEGLLASDLDEEVNPLLKLILQYGIESSEPNKFFRYDKTRPFKTAILENIIEQVKSKPDLSEKFNKATGIPIS